MPSPLARLYEAEAYDTSRPPASHWQATAGPPPATTPLALPGRTGTAVIGAGVCGLAAALALALRGEEVAVLDAGPPGWGASGRSGGFVCIGGTKLSETAILRRFGAGEARAFVRFQEDAVAAVAETIATHAIAAEAGPPGEVCLAHSPAAFAALAAAARAREGLGGARARLVPPADLGPEGLAGPGFFGAAINPVGFPVHPLRYLHGLLGAATAAGVRTAFATPVSDLAPAAGGWRLATPAGPLAAARVLIATNGYSSETLPPWIAGRTLPVLSTILVTSPLPPSLRAETGFTDARMAFDSRTLLHYFRHLPDGRFLFGMRGGVSAAPAAQARTIARARAHLAALFPALAPAGIEHAWSGLACLTGSLTAFAGPVPGAEGLHAAFGWHGSGLAMATLAGRRLAPAILGAPSDLPAPLARAPRRFPLAPLRRTMLAAAYLAAGLADGPVGGRGGRSLTGPAAP
ncbi:MAG: FAD-binding oxidoreductase [Rhodobacteraceae bacterium]|nr:FAD-binding oxidoreductase [Paracoccaceae bacterium]